MMWINNSTGQPHDSALGAYPHGDFRGLRRPGSPYTDDECEEILSKLEEFLDGELTSESESKLLDMIDSCPYCFEQYKIEKIIRKLIKMEYQNFWLSSKLVVPIREQIERIHKRLESEAHTEI